MKINVRFVEKKYIMTVDDFEYNFYKDRIRDWLLSNYNF